MNNGPMIRRRWVRANAGGTRVVVVVALLLLAVRAPAQDAAAVVISPDRPTYANGIQIVPLGHVQAEAGAAVFRIGGATEVTAGEMTVRIPVSSRVEARVQLFSHMTAWGEETSSGVVDPTLDVKWKLFDTDATDFGLIAGTSLPAGARAQGEVHLQPFATFSLDQVVTEALSLTANLGAASASDRGETFGKLYGGLAAALQISPRVTLFLEGYWWSRTKAGGPGEAALDAGLQYFVTGRFALDARVGLGLGRTAPDWSLGLGVAYMF